MMLYSFSLMWFAQGIVMWALALIFFLNTNTMKEISSNPAQGGFVLILFTMACSFALFGILFVTPMFLEFVYCIVEKKENQRVTK